MCYYWNKYYLSHSRDVLLTRALARASAPASPMLLPQSLEKQVIKKTYLWQMQEKYDARTVAGWFTLKISVTCSLSIPLPAALLLLLLYYYCQDC